MTAAIRDTITSQLRALVPEVDPTVTFVSLADATGGVPRLESLAQLGSGHLRAFDIVTDAGAREDLILAIASPLWSEEWAVRVLYPLCVGDEELLRRMAAQDARTMTAWLRNPTNWAGTDIDNLYFQAGRPWAVDVLVSDEGQPLALVGVLPFTVEYF